MLVFRSFATGQGRGTPRAKHATAACGPPRTPTRRPWPLVWDAPEARGVGHAVTNACHPPIPSTRSFSRFVVRLFSACGLAVAARSRSSRSSRVLGRTSALRPPTADRRRCRRRSSFRTRRGHAHGASVHRAHTPAHTRLEASYRHTPRRLPRSLRSRIRARNSTRVRSPRARGLRTRATSDLMRLTTCAPFPHSYTLAMPPDRGRLRHAPRPRREHGLVAA